MPDATFWLSIGIGAGLGIAYVTASLISNKRALRSKDRFMIVFATAMIIRIIIALALLVGIMLLLPVVPTAFLGSFFLMFVIGLVFEVYLLHKWGATTGGRPS